MRRIEYKILENHDGKTVENYLRKEQNISKRLLSRLKQQPVGLICNGAHIRSVDILHSGDILQINMEDTSFLRENPLLSIPIVYEDEHTVVFNKPCDMPVHPSMLHYDDTLGNYFSYLYKELTFRPINRLDKDTSGLCICAKNAHAASLLQNNIDKIYYAVVCGQLTGKGRIDKPIGRADSSIILRTISQTGQIAVTDYEVILGNEKYTLVKVKLQTGRTHQIRVHFSYIGYPLAGDGLYGGNCNDIKFQALHCGEIKFISIDTEKEINIKSEIRKDMQEIIR